MPNECMLFNYTSPVRFQQTQKESNKQNGAKYIPQADKLIPNMSHSITVFHEATTLSSASTEDFSMLNNTRQVNEQFFTSLVIQAHASNC